MKRWLLGFIVLVAVTALAACGGKEASTTDTKDIKIGATAGPYTDMVNKAIKPGLEDKGYKVEVVTFSDYVQPNKALSKGDIQANLFQHTIYLETFSKQNDMKLTGLIAVPTAPMGIYSNTYKSLSDVKDGATIAIPNDPTNAARAFNILEDEGFITVDENANPITISEKDITENKKNLKFQPIEAGQLPRSVESADLAAVPGNYALAAKMDLLSALALENMDDQYRNVVAVTTENKDTQLAKDLKAVVKSDEFEKIIDEEFKGFGKPKWMESK
ncbi:MetQ/NlpA family ABC transporter substrate-binding protein [Pseudalkalibacillus decolorationis]|uniref:MetQ/NlpA family ABC transporter substrate-binding protein n=1 Tax=Pseudalkalibacillus decolorationis TaxID=163879 RepID=UPI0021496B51|nr:MetQ/NlpA family ABC transporter substrate-binding protein [Pseudalkalibacillus decolorationis]